MILSMQVRHQTINHLEPSLLQHHLRTTVDSPPVLYRSNVNIIGTKRLLECLPSLLAMAILARPTTMAGQVTHLSR